MPAYDVLIVPRDSMVVLSACSDGTISSYRAIIGDDLVSDICILISSLYSSISSSVIDVTALIVKM